MKAMKKAWKVIAAIVLSLLLIIIFYLFCIRKSLANGCLQSTLSAMSDGDYTEGFYYTDMNGNLQKSIDTSELGYRILLNTEFEIEELQIPWNDIVGSAVVRISYPDVYGIFQESFSSVDEVIDSAEIEETLIAELTAETGIKYRTETFEVTIIQSGYSWYLVESEALLNVYTGGIYQEYKAFLERTLANKPEE